MDEALLAAAIRLRTEQYLSYDKIAALLGTYTRSMYRYYIVKRIGHTPPTSHVRTRTALRLWRKNWSWPRIADKLGYADEHSARYSVFPKGRTSDVHKFCLPSRPSTWR